MSSASELYAKANEAFVEEDIEEALSFYNQAIEASKSAPQAEYFYKRALAHGKLKKTEDSLADLNTAIGLTDGKEALNELLVKVLGKKGDILFKQKDYVGAKEVYERARDLAKNPSKLNDLISKCEPHVTKIQAQKAVAAAAAIPPVAPMVKRDWDYFQNDSNLTINVYIRNARKENVTVEIFERAVNVSVKTADGRDIIHDFDPLLHPIIAAESSFEVLSTKIEIVLKKATAGKLWPELTGDDVAVAAETESAESAALSASAKAAAGFAPPSYPSSSRFGPKNWDKIGKEAEKEEEEVRKKHGDGNIFGLLYKDADEDTKRAMMKSYQESGGTCLSMNWKEVGKQRTKIEPPEGMVAKKYEY